MSIKIFKFVILNLNDKKLPYSEKEYTSQHTKTSLFTHLLSPLPLPLLNAQHFLSSFVTTINNGDGT